MKRLLVFGVLLVLLSASVAGAASTSQRATPFPGSDSWADARHGWAPNVFGGELCAERADVDGDSTLCATEDGGRTWREIFAGGSYIFDAQRTSSQAGIVSTGAYGHYEYWTRDNGRHWYRAALAGISEPAFPSPMFAGKGAEQFYGASAGDTVYRLTPWPPPAPACEEGWSRSVVETEAHPAGNICLDSPADAGVGVPVATVPGRQLARLARVPGGFFALFVGGRPYTTLVRRGGRNVVRDLPATAVPAGSLGGIQRVAISWPSITLVAQYRGDTEPDDDPLNDPEQSHEVIWRSTDGGATWSTRHRVAWRFQESMPTLRASAAAGVVGDEIVLAGGYASRTVQWREDREVSRIVEAYRPRSKRWRRLPDLPVAVARAAGASAGGELYVVGGVDRKGTVRRDAFVLGRDGWRRLPRAPEARAAAGAVVVGNKLYVVGGRARTGLARRMLVLDLRSRRWSVAPAPRPRAYLAVAAAGGRIFALGGTRAGPEVSLALAESWRPGEQRWRRLPPLPFRRMGAAAVGHEGRVIVVGGTGSSYHYPLASAVVLEPGKARWEALPDLVVPRHSGSAAVVGGSLYLLAGSDSWGERNTMSFVSESLTLP